MPGHGIDMNTNSGYFAGVVFVSSLQYEYYNLIQTFICRNIWQLKKIYRDRYPSPHDLFNAIGRTYNGHTALMVGENKNIEKIVGWDPFSAKEAFINSAKDGYEEMKPIAGQWRDDIGMDGDYTALYYGVSITEYQYEQFKTFISALIGRKDFGPEMEKIGITFKYAFAPARQMQDESSLENKELSKDKIDIISNCADAAFHVLATFLYDWKKFENIKELMTFLSVNNKSNQNFSQGKLMQWSKAGTEKFKQNNERPGQPFLMAKL